MSLRRYLAGFHPPVDESVLIDATAWVADELFWPAFLISVGGSRTAAVAFGADPADVEGYAEDLHHSDHWPYVVVPLASGDRLHVLFRNFDGDAAWDYLLHSADTGTVSTVAVLDGDHPGAAFSWPDLVRIANQPDPTRNAAERLLLLLPAMVDADVPGDAEQVVAGALLAVGVAPRHRQEVARELLQARRRG